MIIIKMDNSEIFNYNILWLLDRKNLNDSVSLALENFVRKTTPVERLKKFERSEKNYITGSLIDNESSYLLKQKITGNIINYLINFSKFAVPYEIFRYKTCQTGSISRPGISFITTLNQAYKLIYILQGVQREPFEFFYFSYSKIKNVKKKERKIKSSFTDLKERYFTGSKYIRKYIIREENSFDSRIFIPMRFRYTSNYNGVAINERLYIFEEYYYKKILESFAKSVNNKLKRTINLDEWCFVFVFSPLWCDKNHMNFSEKLDTMLNIPNLPEKSSFQNFEIKNFLRDTSLKYNSYRPSPEVDISLLYYLSETFKSKELPLKDFSITEEGLESFEHLQESFKRFEDGGYWIKRLKKDLKNKPEEIVRGPYSKEVALEKIKIVRNIYSTEKYIPKVFSFKDLVCETNVSEIRNPWVPKPGVTLFCLVKGFSLLVYYKKENLTKDFEKYHNYATDNSMKFFQTFDYLIYFNPNNNVSVKRALALKKVLKDKNNFTSENFVWFLTFLTDKKIEGNRPKVIPFNLQDLGVRTSLTYEDLKNISEKSDSPERSFDIVKTNINNNFVYNFRDKNYNFKTLIKLNIDEENDLEKTKTLYLEKGFNNLISLEIKKLRVKLKDISLISLKQTEKDKKEGILNVNFKNFRKGWKKTKLDLLKSDEFFNNEIVLINFFLFLGKCFKFENILLDTSKKKSECSTVYFINYYITLYLASENLKILEELKFTVENEELFKSTLDTLSKITVKDFILERLIKDVSLNENFEKMTVRDLCKEYLKSETCPEKKILKILNYVDEYVEEKIGKLKISVNLNEIEFSDLEKYIFE